MESQIDLRFAAILDGNPAAGKMHPSPFWPGEVRHDDDGRRAMPPAAF
jgi:hypothetical protein